jgi:aconitate hydratase
MGGGAYNIAWPKVVGIRLEGQLPSGVSAKDVILAVLQKFGSKGNVGKIFEYYGPGVATLDVPSRATITNMGAELGVTTSVFPSDETTKAFLEAQGRGEDWVALTADDECYDETWTLNLSTLEPLAAAPHNPGNIETIASHVGEKVHQIMIGSCTNSSYRDIKTVALLLKGKQVHPDVEVGIACGSKQVVRMLADEGLLGELIASGCRILENACGFCIGAHMSPSTNAVCLRTSNRNFEGRSGTQSAKVYLVSPETAAASALTGTFADARQLDVPAVAMPEHFTIDDGMFLYRETAGTGVSDTTILRGPNIGEVPPGTPLAETLVGVATVKVGDKITTDHIMPAGARLKYRSNIPQYAKYVFEHTDPTFYTNASANRDAGKANIIIAGESYGQGSSREHAALCPMYLGIRAVIAKTIERIHRANLINFGIIPFAFVNPDDYDTLSAGDELVIENLRDAIQGNGRATVKNLTNNTTFDVETTLSERQQRLLLAGGLLAAVAQGEV